MRREVERAPEARRAGLDARAALELVVSGDDGTGPFGSAPARRAFLAALDPGQELPPELGAAPEVLRRTFDPQARLAAPARPAPRDRPHSQQLLRRRASTPGGVLGEGSTRSQSPEKCAESVEPYREYFYDDVIGRFDQPLLDRTSARGRSTTSRSTPATR